MAALMTGRASPAGTLDYAARMADMAERTSEGHFRRLGDVTLSSIGLGTYLGAPDDESDASRCARSSWAST